MPALFPLPRGAANDGRVTWFGKHVNILPAAMGIKGSSKFQACLPQAGSKFKVQIQRPLPFLAQSFLRVLGVLNG
jgi:hypothetical protein